MSKSLGINNYNIDDYSSALTEKLLPNNSLPKESNGQSNLNPPHYTEYGDATAKILENYIRDYKMPKMMFQTGFVFPTMDMYRNYMTMRNMKLKEADPFFHCKANYEATLRGLDGLLVANLIDIAKEAKDTLVSDYSLSDSLQDYRANFRGQIGALAGKTLQESCPTHSKFYK